MSTRRRTKLVREGQYAAAVEVEWIESDTAWSPYLSLDDAQKLMRSGRRCAGAISSAPGNWAEFTSSLVFPCEYTANEPAPRLPPNFRLP